MGCVSRLVVVTQCVCARDIAVNWNLDTEDFSAASSQEIVDRVAQWIRDNNAGGSAIHLQHDRSSISASAVAAIVDLVKGAGYDLVTLDECMYVLPLRSLMCVCVCALPPCVCNVCAPCGFSYGRGVSSLRDYQVQDCAIRCGDGVCSADEDCTSCASDCTCDSVCGDGVCDADESCDTCCQDCGVCDTGGGGGGGGSELPVSTNGRCGTNSPEGAVCPTGLCCSQYGWCVGDCRSPCVCVSIAACLTLVCGCCLPTLVQVWYICRPLQRLPAVSAHRRWWY